MGTVVVTIKVNTTWTEDMVAMEFEELLEESVFDVSLVAASAV